jgi:hypothetical protein
MKKLILLVAAVLLLGACDIVSQKFANTGAPKLQFAGDSITYQATADINAHYRGPYDVAIDGFSGYDTYQMAGIVATEATLAPAVEVINLGTNDAIRIGQDQTGVVDGKTVVTEPAAARPEEAA